MHQNILYRDSEKLRRLLKPQLDKGKIFTRNLAQEMDKLEESELTYVYNIREWCSKGWIPGVHKKNFLIVLENNGLSKAEVLDIDKAWFQKINADLKTSLKAYDARGILYCLIEMAGLDVPLIANALNCHKGSIHNALSNPNYEYKLIERMCDILGEHNVPESALNTFRNLHTNNMNSKSTQFASLFSETMSLVHLSPPKLAAISGVGPRNLQRMVKRPGQYPHVWDKVRKTLKQMNAPESSVEQLHFLALDSKDAHLFANL